MDLDVLIHFCNLQSSTYQLPYTIYMNNKPVSYSSSFLKDFDLLSSNLAIFQNSDSHVRYFVTEDFLVFGYIKSSDDTLILVGPGAIGALSEKDAGNIIYKYIKDISLNEKEIVKNHLLELPVISIELFLIALCTVNCFINHEILTTQNLLTKGIEENVWLKTQLKLINIEQKEIYEAPSEQHPLINYEQQIAFCIKNGMTDVLKDVMENKRYDLGKLGPDALRHFKNATIILNSISLRAAISGGLNADTCYKLGGLYIQQLEACQNIESLSRVSASMLIDYCTRVQYEQTLNTNDEMINKCINYIFTNYREKITVQIIAKNIGISSEYLSSKFKKITGINLPAFINQKKIQEAKKLIVFTKMPLLEISEYLSFSNQSYFQTIFKLEAGVTPLQYRKQSNLHSQI